MRPVVLWRTLPVGLALLSASCGLNTSSSPEPLPDEAVPEQLGGDQLEATTDETRVEEQDLYPMWFVDTQPDDTRLLVQEPIPIQRDPSVGLVFETLLGQPTDALTETEGLTSAIPPGIAVNGVTEVDEDGEVVVDLPEEFFVGPEQGNGLYAFGQVVMTLTELPEVESVSFLRDGEEVPVLDGDGAEVEVGDQPVTRREYDAITRTE